MLDDVSPKDWLALGCAAFALAAGLASLYAAWGIDIRDSLDTMLEDERRLASWNRIGAALNIISAALALAAILLFRRKSSLSATNDHP